MKLHSFRLMRAPRLSRIVSLCFSFFVFFFQFIGGYLDNELTIPFTQVLLSILFSVVPAIICAELLLRLNEAVTKRRSAKPVCFRKSDKYMFLLFTGIILLCWFPFFLAYYPGILAYDIRSQVFQTMGSYITDHPLIHTLMLQGFIRLGLDVLKNVNAGIALYTLLQMGITGVCAGYTALFLYRCGVRKAVLIILEVFVCLFPVWPILAISATKDILFADFFLLCAVCLAYWCKAPELLGRKRFHILFGTSLFFACLLRTGSFLLAGAVMILSIFLPLVKSSPKKFFYSERFRIFFTGAASVLLAVIAGTVLTAATQATTMKYNENISVPLQQVSFAFNSHKEEMTEEEKETVYELIRYVDSYKPHSADYVKDYHIDAGGDERFWQLYLRFMKRYPGDYLAAWLNNTMGLWYLWDTSSTHIYGSLIWETGGVGYLLTDMHNETLELGIHRNSKFPWLLNRCQELVNGNSFLEIPVFRILFSMALYFWLAMLALTFAIINRAKNSVLLFVFTTGYILGVFFCPCVLVRYCFPFIICIPLLFAAASPER